MNIKEKKIVVTGAAGLIGSNLTDSLLEQGAEVIGIDNLYLEIHQIILLALQEA